MHRLTGSAFRDLAIWMIGLGLGTGIVFPPFALALGLPAGSVLTPTFIAACLGAGLMVGGLNYALARSVVGSRVRLLAGRMETVRDNLEAATWSGDWSTCSPERCALPVDSRDEFGEAAGAFNSLIQSLSASHDVETAVREFSATLARHADLASVSRHALDELLEKTGGTAGALLVDMDGALVVGAASGLAQADSLATNAVVAEAIRSGRARRLEAPAGMTIDAAVTTFAVHSVIVAPLTFKSVPVGVAIVASSTPFGEAAERLTEILQPLLAVALNNAVTHERIQRLATLDPLTGLFNRRFGLTRLREEYKRTIRTELPLAVAMFDIDHFKAVNDTYGHAVGDRVLIAAARAARRALREGDVLIRYGGEEFLVLLLGASREDGAAVCERIRRSVEETIVQDGEQSIRVTVSIGVAAIPDDAVEHEDDLVKSADAALYSAKNGGRNRVVLA